MAVIGKIREKSGLLVFIVGLGLLLFIIPFDRIIQSFQGTGEQPLGEINGTEIMDSKWKFNERAQNMFNGYSGVPEDYKIQQETQLWNQIMIDTLLKIEVTKLSSSRKAPTSIDTSPPSVLAMSLSPGRKLIVLPYSLDDSGPTSNIAKLRVLGSDAS